jgi:hypothetical protein
MEHQNPHQHKANRLAFHRFSRMHCKENIKMDRKQMKHQNHQSTQHGTPKHPSTQGLYGSVPLVQEYALYGTKRNKK